MAFEQESLGERFLAIQHRLNPLHVYCRLLERGLGRRISTSIGKSYEALVFIWLSWIIKTVICILFAMNRGHRIRREFKRR
jgi:hypothetical protein